MTRQQVLSSLLDEFDALQTREILLAKEGLKVSRTLAAPEELARKVALLEALGLYVAIYEKKYIFCPDSGKGGWVSRYGLEEPLESNHGFCMLYVGDSPDRVLAAKNREHSQDDAGFGEALGIPSCCVDMYVSATEKAELKQNDYLQFTLENTRTPYPHNFWNNIAAQYFGYCFISHYPCSFDCAPSAKMSQQVCDILSGYSQELTGKFKRCHQDNYIYTEYDGIFRLTGSTFCDGAILYEPSRMEVTLDSLLASVLRRGDRIEVLGKHRFQIWNSRGGQLGEFDHPDTSILIFGCEA